MFTELSAVQHNLIALAPGLAHLNTIVKLFPVCMISCIEKGYISTNCQPHLRTLDLVTLLGDNAQLPSPTKGVIMDATQKYIHDRVHDIPRQF